MKFLKMEIFIPRENTKKLMEKINEGEIFTVPCVETAVKTDKGGEVYALSYCNIHGLWENSVEA